MEIEYEATFPNREKEDVREKLRLAGATLVRSEYTQKRRVYHLPEGHEITGGWVRVRDEGDKIMITLKVVDGEKIENQKEINLKVNDFESACELVSALGCKEKAYQVTRRELWTLDDVEVTIDEWPFLEPFVEVEGKSEEGVKAVSEKLGFDYSEALFCAVGTLYANKYGISEDVINNETPVLDFESKNPFCE